MTERAISLSKGRSLTLEKGIKRIKISLEWDENRRSTKVTEDFDIDLICIEVDVNGKALSPDHLVFFNSIIETENHELTDPEHAVIYGGDDLTGAEGESMDVEINKIHSDVDEIRFFANIYDASNRRQTFGDIRNATVKVFQDGKDTPSIVYTMTDDFKNDTFLYCCRLKRVEGRIFKFIAEGEGNNKELIDNLQGYGLRFK